MHYLIMMKFLNQACTGQRPAHNWFLEIAFVQDVCILVCVCVSVSVSVCPHPEVINN